MAAQKDVEQLVRAVVDKAVAEIAGATVQAPGAEPVVMAVPAHVQQALCIVPSVVYEAYNVNKRQCPTMARRSVQDSDIHRYERLSVGM